MTRQELECAVRLLKQIGASALNDLATLNDLASLEADRRTSILATTAYSAACRFADGPIVEVRVIVERPSDVPTT